MIVHIEMKDPMTKHVRWRNDRLMKDANTALNILLRKGYLESLFPGYRGRVREDDGSKCRIIVNTRYKGTLICALLKLYFPSREIKEVN